MNTYVFSQPQAILTTNDMVQQNWEECAATAQGCFLSSNLPVDPVSPIVGSCYQGSVPNYYIDVQKVSDVQAGLAFAQKHSIPLVVKNTGHGIAFIPSGFSATSR